jgi:hypothetical protein
MSVSTAVFPDVKTAVLLAAREQVQRCPNETGIYAAWIRDRTGLAEVGISGPLPRLMYVGIGGSRGGLRARLKRHASSAFLPTNELLAARGVVLAGWGDRYAPKTSGRMAKKTPLLDLASEQTLAWQHKRFRWAWQPCSPELARLSELAAVSECSPILNLSGAVDGMPPQLRAMGRNERARARWLWHISWAALLIGYSTRSRPPVDKDLWREWSDSDNTRRIAVDPLGFPMPRAEVMSRRQVQTVRTPSLDEIWDMMRRAARGATPEVRAAVNEGRPDDDELAAWWAAHAGAPYLPQPVSVQTSIAQSFKLFSEQQAACPERLPNEARVQELSKMLTMLDGANH